MVAYPLLRRLGGVGLRALPSQLASGASASDEWQINLPGARHVQIDSLWFFGVAPAQRLRRRNQRSIHAQPDLPAIGVARRRVGSAISAEERQEAKLARLRHHYTASDDAARRERLDARPNRHGGSIEYQVAVQQRKRWRRRDGRTKPGVAFHPICRSGCHCRRASRIRERGVGRGIDQIPLSRLHTLERVEGWLGGVVDIRVDGPVPTFVSPATLSGIV